MFWLFTVLLIANAISNPLLECSGMSISLNWCDLTVGIIEPNFELSLPIGRRWREQMGQAAQRAL